ncbi:hypothetical protein [Sphingomicrobium nitratireducens]|uniref:hypothetical protein n=1 Tax=Sphingomicrobium nitratireducens TaxID=2964666 RepID=UPI00224010EB|nr:hypothetical protein [Sphingomicrobium nitratireducens]
MDPSEMVVIIVSIVFGWMMLKLLLTAIFGAERMGLRSRHPKHMPAPMQDDAAIRRLEHQVEALTDRLKVLERITVEDGHSLAAEIERLREPSKLGYGGPDEQLARPDRSSNRV